MYVVHPPNVLCSTRRPIKRHRVSELADDQVLILNIGCENNAKLHYLIGEAARFECHGRSWKGTHGSAARVA
jgi:hypothetical protein